MFLFHRFLQGRYSIVRSKFPGEGRRKWRLRVIEDLWLAPNIQAEIASTAPISSRDSPQTDNPERDGDPWDHLTEGEEVGLLVRTDSTDDIAWNEFLQQLRDSEKAFLNSLVSVARDDLPTGAVLEMEEDASESDSDADTTSQQIIKVLPYTANSPFEDISNLTALRLLNDVDLRLTLPVPSGVNRIEHGNRLTDSNGLQEVYMGKTIWIYDKKSNLDASVRLISPQSDMYGTATGDSWRARARHVAELQFSMSYDNVRINFGGLDRWDQSERARNINEAENQFRSQ